MGALNHADRRFESLFHLVVDHDGIVMLHAKKQFLDSFVDRDAERAVWGVEFAVRGHIADGLAGENNQVVDCVVVYRIDIAVGRIDVEPALEFDSWCSGRR